ncbi:MAG: hypothetical protein DMD80_09945 [Candidatus Rokuibacteriota bacterium]|nr:MAG: hypothetical protein DMD80_09945 [Candidatus Rokubacteria bacterium]
MRALMTAIVVAALLGGCATTEPHSTYEAASVPASPAGEWRGTASEFQAPYIGTAAARVTLNLNADGTWSETWTEGARTSSDSGRWSVRGNTVVLESSGRMHTRMMLRRGSDALYTVAVESLLSGRTTTMTIDLHPVGH